MKSRSAVRRAISCIVFRASSVAVMSRKTISSAPSCSYALGQAGRIADVGEVLELDALDDPRPP